MIFTAKNSQKYLENYHYINIPHTRLFMTLLLHCFFLNIGMVLMYYWFAISGGLILSWEIFYLMTFVRMLWRRSGYSQPLFFTLIAVNLTADFFLAFLERWLIGILFEQMITVMGGY